MPFKLEVLASQGSGECLERSDYLRAIELVETGDVDVVITEDLGRICRRVHAHIFAELCEDKKTRLLALNDHIDTARNDWRLNSHFAIMRHESYNRDTSARIKRSQRNRFDQGGMCQFRIYGYLQPPGAKHESEIRKDPSAQPIYEEMFRKLETGASYAEVADWLNKLGIHVGPNCDLKRWDGRMVARVVHNKILKGHRERNKRTSLRINKTGKRKSVKADAEDLIVRNCPHLAFFEEAYYDRVIRLVDQRNACYCRKGTAGVDTRANVPKKRTTWPGQHLTCGICGRIFYWNGIGKGKSLKCSGNQNYLCWNGLEVNGAMVGQKLAAAILAAIEALPDFDLTFFEKIQTEWRKQEEGRSGHVQELLRKQRDLHQQIERTTDAIARLQESQALLAKLQELEAQKAKVDDDLVMLEKSRAPELVIPSLDDIKAAARGLFANLAANDPEVGRILHVLIPKLKALPYQLCDGGAMVLCAHLELNLGALVGEKWDTPPELLIVKVVVDLFDHPQKVKNRAEVIARRASGQTEAQVAAALGITITAAQYAAALHRRMVALGVDDPYQPLTAPPAKGFSRHLHPRYHFEPLKQEPQKD